MDASEYMETSLEIIKETFACSRRSAAALERIAATLEAINQPLEAIHTFTSDSDEVLSLRNHVHQLRSELYARNTEEAESASPV